MNAFLWDLKLTDADETRFLAQVLALKLRAGDVVALRGDLGAGKTTFARALIRAITGVPELDVPSPTFALLQTYESPRFEIRHYDFYRLDSTDEAQELGFEDALDAAVSIIEWPENAAAILPTNCIDVALAEPADDDGDSLRIATVTASADAGQRLARARAIWQYLADWSKRDGRELRDLSVGYLQGDASTRSYARLRHDANSWLLMDSPRQPDGPPIRDGRPYSQFAHLAEDIQPFVVIAEELRRNGFSAPAIIDVDPAAGLAVIEDLGDAVFSDEIARGNDLRSLYAAAMHVLVRLREVPVPPLLDAHGCSHAVPAFDSEVLSIEIDLLLQWFAPSVLGQRLDEAACDAFFDAWRAQFDRLRQSAGCWVLRDYHSPNLIWLQPRPGLRKVGLIDFQDAQVGHPAYDLASLLQDARLDVPEAIEAELLTRYCAAARRADAGFDEAEFRWAYALLGAQRNTKILGIFTRLDVRDGKSWYLRHIPRIIRYLQRDLAHPELHEIRAWFAANLPSLLDATTAPPRTADT